MDTSGYTETVTVLNATPYNVTSYPPADDLILPHVSAAGVVLGVIIIAVGTFGNILVILAVILSKPLFKASNVFIVSLAMCDLFQTVTVRPLFVHTYLVRQWQFSSQVCLYALYASNLAILVSILHVSAIALFRYVIIVHPRVSRACQRRCAVVLLLVLILTLPLVITLAPSIRRLQSSPTLGEDLFFNKHIMFCTYNQHSESSVGGVIRKAAFLGGAACFLFYCYIRIYHVVRISGKSINMQGTFSPTRLRREITLLKTVIIVFLTFVACYLPVTVVYAVDRKGELPHLVHLVCVMLLWTSSSVNWMIYGLMNKQYRQGYRYVLCRQGRGAQSGIPTENGSGASRISQNASFREMAETQRRVSRARANSAAPLRGYNTVFEW